MSKRKQKQESIRLQDRRRIDVYPNSNIRKNDILEMVAQRLLQRVYRFRSSINCENRPTDPEIIAMECIYSDFLTRVVNFGNDHVLHNFSYSLQMEEK